MKVVEYKNLSKKRRKNKCYVICINNVFRNCMIVGSVALFLLVLNLVSKTFLNDAVASLQQFVESFARFGV